MMQCLSLSAWLIPLDIMSSRSIRVAANNVMSSVFVHGAHFIVSVCRCYFISLSVDGWVGWLHILAIVNTASFNLGRQLWLPYSNFTVPKYFIFLEETQFHHACTYTLLELLDETVASFVIVWEAPRGFVVPMVTVISPNSVWEYLCVQLSSENLFEIIGFFDLFKLGWVCIWAWFSFTV